MNYFWIILNFAFIGLGFLGGYKTMNPESLRHINPDATLCLIILFIMPLFALGSVSYSVRRWNRGPLSRPSWTRNPFDWWGDPLQSLFILTCYMGAMAVGSAFRHPSFRSVGFWTLGVYACFTLGLWLGQILVYRVFRKRICSKTAEINLPGSN